MLYQRVLFELHTGALSSSTCCRNQLPEHLLEPLVLMGQKGYLQRLPSVLPQRLSGTDLIIVMEDIMLELRGQMGMLHRPP